MKVDDSSAPATAEGGAPAWIRARTSWPRQVPISRKRGAGGHEEDDVGGEEEDEVRMESRRE